MIGLFVSTLVLPQSPIPSLEKPSGIAARLLCVIPSLNRNPERDDLVGFSRVPGTLATQLTKKRRISRVETLVGENGRQSIVFPWRR